eukprot:SAG31_NODE_71_length_28115_cov_4.128105_4_plen_200_part_00
MLLRMGRPRLPSRRRGSPARTPGGAASTRAGAHSDPAALPEPRHAAHRSTVRSKRTRPASTESSCWGPHVDCSASPALWQHRQERSDGGSSLLSHMWRGLPMGLPISVFSDRCCGCCVGVQMQICPLLLRVTGGVPAALGAAAAHCRCTATGWYGSMYASSIVHMFFKSVSCVPAGMLHLGKPAVDRYSLPALKTKFSF